MIAVYRIGLGFGKSGAWAVLYFFVPLVWSALIAYGATAPWRPTSTVAAPTTAPAMAPGDEVHTRHRVRRSQRRIGVMMEA